MCAASSSITQPWCPPPATPASVGTHDGWCDGPRFSTKRSPSGPSGARTSVGGLPATCGGITAEVWEAWPAPPLPYLVSHRDNGSSPDHCAKSPQYRWQESWSAAEFISNIERFAPLQNVALPAGKLGNLEDGAWRSRSHSGRVGQLEVRTSAGSVLIPAYSIRQVLRRGGQPDAILRSNLFKIDVRRDPVTRKAIQVVANGAGSGHGVGLCQTGALGMSRAGQTGEEILRHYYPGAKLENLY